MQPAPMSDSAPRAASETGANGANGAPENSNCFQGGSAEGSSRRAPLMFCSLRETPFAPVSVRDPVSGRDQRRCLPRSLLGLGLFKYEDHGNRQRRQAQRRAPKSSRRSVHERSHELRHHRANKSQRRKSNKSLGQIAHASLLTP